MNAAEAYAFRLRVNGSNLKERKMKMREILFRGKRIDNSEWVEGTLILTTAVEQKPYIVDSCWCPYMKTNERGYADFDWLNAYEVIPETVGQYTGLTDKNGKRIFEGDILREYIENSECEYDYDYFDCGEVFWYGQQSRFLRTSRMFVDDCPKITENREYEVVGNIHDNPELLKEVAQNGG